jgi:5'-nucleotidase
MPSAAPRAVVSNDDGIASDGLAALAAAAIRAGCTVVVAAPDYDASGSGASLAAVADHGQIAIERRALAGLDGTPAYAVRAQPAYIASSAADGAFGERPDLLLSGINAGPNFGRAILHSGTVGAALTAAVHGIPAAAFSLDLRGLPAVAHWETAASVAAEVIPVVRELPAGTALNVNVPNVDPGALRGIRRAGLAAFGTVQMGLVEEPGGRLRITRTASQDAGPPPWSDSALLASGYATVTAIQPLAEATAVELPWPSPTAAGTLSRRIAPEASTLSAVRPRVARAGAGYVPMPVA